MRTTLWMAAILVSLCAGSAHAEPKAPAEKKAPISKPMPRPLPAKSDKSTDKPIDKPASEVIEQSLSFEAVGRGVVAAKQDHDFACSPRSSAGVFDNEVVFVGYGIVDEAHKYNSYRGMPEGFLKGKIALAFNYEPQNHEGDSLWMPAPPRPASAATNDSPEGIAGKKIGQEVGPAGKLGKGGVGPWSPSASLHNKAKWAAERGAAALLLVDGPAQDVADPVSKSAKAAGEGERFPIPVFHIRSLFFRSLLQRGGGGKNVDAIIEAFEADANKGNGSLNDETGVEPLRDIRLWGAVILPEPKK